MSSSRESVSSVVAHISLSLRIYPHLQDMGGFFVAVLTRKDDNVPLTRTQRALHTAGKRAASQEPEVPAPDAKRVKVACLCCKLPSKPIDSYRKPMSTPIPITAPLLYT